MWWKMSFKQYYNNQIMGKPLIYTGKYWKVSPILRVRHYGRGSPPIYERNQLTHSASIMRGSNPCFIPAKLSGACTPFYTIYYRNNFHLLLAVSRRLNSLPFSTVNALKNWCLATEFDKLWFSVHLVWPLLFMTQSGCQSLINHDPGSR